MQVIRSSYILWARFMKYYIKSKVMLKWEMQTCQGWRIEVTISYQEEHFFGNARWCILLVQFIHHWQQVWESHPSPHHRNHSVLWGHLIGVSDCSWQIHQSKEASEDCSTLTELHDECLKPHWAFIYTLWELGGGVVLYLWWLWELL